MKIMEDQRYYIDNYTTLTAYMQEFLRMIKDKRIKSFVAEPGTGFSRPHKVFTKKVYATDGWNYLIFEGDMILKFRYNIFSMIYLELTHIAKLRDPEWKALGMGEGFDFDCRGKNIVDYELHQFRDAYIIEPSCDTVRPEGGDYFKEIIFHLSNQKKICICAQNAEFDGWCDIWMEENSEKGAFHGSIHKVPWEITPEDVRNSWW